MSQSRIGLLKKKKSIKQQFKNSGSIQLVTLGPSFTLDESSLARIEFLISWSFTGPKIIERKLCAVYTQGTLMGDYVMGDMSNYILSLKVCVFDNDCIYLTFTYQLLHRLFSVYLWLPDDVLAFFFDNYRKQEQQDSRTYGVCFSDTGNSKNTFMYNPVLP